ILYEAQERLWFFFISRNSLLEQILIKTHLLSTRRHEEIASFSHLLCLGMHRSVMLCFVTQASQDPL
ncbi:MAG: hypothetical protein ACK559_17915, partial [bacterium]